MDDAGNEREFIIKCLSEPVEVQRKEVKMGEIIKTTMILVKQN
jgi:hypothetical protein